MTNRRDFLKKSAVVGAVAAITPMSVMGKNVKNKSSVSSNPVNTYTVDMRATLRMPVIPPRLITIPDTAGFKVLKGDFHIHTLFSDGSVMPEDRVHEAVLNGLDIISITDHIEYRPYFSKNGKWKLIDEQANDFNISYNIAKPLADKKQLLLIPGTEITKSYMPPGHFNVLFTKDVNPIAAAKDDWKEMLRIAADQGCFLIWNHPGWQDPNGGGIVRGTPLRFTDAHEEIFKKGMMHGIEIFNGSEYYPIVSDWCNERDLALFANSDIHASEINQYGMQNPKRPITLVLAKDKTVESVKEAMFARRTIAWAANMLWGHEKWLKELFNASVSIKTITPGTFDITNNSSLPITISIGGVSFVLPEAVDQHVYRAEGVDKVKVLNWMSGMNKPLEIPLT